MYTHSWDSKLIAEGENWKLCRLQAEFHSKPITPSSRTPKAISFTQMIISRVTSIVLRVVQQCCRVMTSLRNELLEIISDAVRQ